MAGRSGDARPCAWWSAEPAAKRLCRIGGEGEGSPMAPLSDEEIAALNIPNSVPLLYELGPGMRPMSRGRYL